ncbi:putative signal transducing protein [Wenyingzhuangia sp. IMCC45574]
MAYVKIFSGSLVDTQHMRQLIQQVGIEPVLKDTANTALMSGFGAVNPDFQELFVHQDEVDKALEVMQNKA